MNLYVWKSFVSAPNSCFGATFANSKEDAIENLMTQFRESLDPIRRLEEQAEGARQAIYFRYFPTFTVPPSNMTQKTAEYNVLEKTMRDRLTAEEPLVRAN